MSDPVQLFHTCLVNEIAPEVGMAAVRLLERLGHRVEVPLAQTCCGQPAYNAGFHEEAKAAARHTLDVLGATTGPIVIPSGSCGDMVIHQYEVLFRDEPEWREKAHAVAARCRELSQFLAEEWAKMPDRPRLSARIAYHPSCHLLRGLGVSDAPLSPRSDAAIGFVIITGLSGAGKSYAIKCLEDMGYFCVDNLPTTLIPTFAELCAQSSREIRKIALGVDVR